MSGIKTTVGCCGANIYNRTVINAEDVEYDNTALLYPPGTDNVQEALDSIAGPAFSTPMTPTVLGLAFGEQPAGTGRNCLGEFVDSTAPQAISIYAGVIPQVLTNHDESILVQNWGDLTTLDARRSITMTNDCSYITGGQNLRESINLLNSVTIPINVDSTNGIHIASNCQIESTGGIDSKSSIALVAGDPLGPNVVSLGEQSCAISNGITNETLSVKEFNASQFDIWRLKTIPSATASEVLGYDSVTGLVTRQSAASALASPTSAGSVYGDVLGAPTSQLSLGYNCFSPATASGLNLYSSPISAAQTEFSPFEDVIYLSSASQANTHYTGSIAVHLSASLTQDMPFSVSMLAVAPSFSMPVRNSLLLAVSGQTLGTAGGGVDKTDAIALSSGFFSGANAVNLNDHSISLSNGLAGHTCATGELYLGSISKFTLAGTLPTASTAATNLFLRRDPATGEIAAGPLAPLKSTLVENDQLLTRDAVSGLVSYNNTAKRTFTFQGSTNGSGQFTQSLATLSLTVVPRVIATVVNASTTVGYLAQVNAISTGSVTIQVLNSVTLAVLGATMVASGAGILVDVAILF